MSLVLAKISLESVGCEETTNCNRFAISFHVTCMRYFPHYYAIVERLKSSRLVDIASRFPSVYPRHLLTISPKQIVSVAGQMPQSDCYTVHNQGVV
jgi:hypothetical protein